MTSPRVSHRNVTTRLVAFSAEALAGLLNVRNIDGKLHVINRESSTKEFKESFALASLGVYVRTMAGFANARGGYIFFGVKDSPRLAVGLSEAGRDQFDKVDPARLTSSLNDLFSPEIQWEIGTIQLESGVELGAIYTHEATEKPVVVKKSLQDGGAKLVEGDIIYRYNSRTERAKYPEVRRMLDHAKSAEQRAMIAHIRELVRAGARNAAVLDFSASTLTGPNGQQVLVDKSVLDQLEFIREGEFDEVRGAPALRVVGDVQPAVTISLGDRVVKETLTAEDVLIDFLNNAEVSNAESYLKQAATATVSFLPVRHFQAQASLDDAALVEFLDSIPTRSQAKRRIMERIESKDPMRRAVPPEQGIVPSSLDRRRYYDALVVGRLEGLTYTNALEAKHLMEAIASLEVADLVRHASGLRELMLAAFSSYYGSHAGLEDGLRRAACRLDVALHSQRLT